MMATVGYRLSRDEVTICGSGNRINFRQDWDNALLYRLLG